MISLYRPQDWYWIVGADEAQVYASARSAFVPADDATCTAWLAAHERNVPTRIDTYDSLVAVLRAANVPPYHLVAKRVIVDRLQSNGKLDAARAALDAADLYTRERWNTRDMIFADDPTARGLLVSIGADPDVILAAG